MLGAFLRDGGKAGADFDALDRVDAHHRVRDIGIEPIVDRLAPADGNAGRDDFDSRAARIAGLAKRIHERLELGDLRRVRSEEWIGIDMRPVFEADRRRTEMRQTTSYHDAEAFAQPFARDRAGGDAHRRFARRLSSAAAIVANAVFLPVRVIGVAGSKRVGDVCVVFAARVLIANQKRDRRAGRAAFEYAGEDFNGVRFAALRYVARSTGAASIEVALDVGFAQLQSRRTAVNDAADRRSVRFTERRDREQFPEGIAGHRRVVQQGSRRL